MLKAAPEGVTAETIINKYAMAKMNAKTQADYDDKLKSIQQIEVYRLAEMKEYGVKLYMYTAQAFPNKSGNVLYMTSAMGGQVAESAWFNGEEGREKDARGKDEAYAGADLARKKLTSYPVGQLANLENDTVEVVLMGIATYNDKPHYKVKVVEGEQLSFEYYDVVTSLLSKVESIVKDENGDPIETLVTFADYAEKNGVMIATKQTINAQGQVLEFNLIKAETNKKAKAKIFSGKMKVAQKALVALSLGK